MDTVQNDVVVQIAYNLNVEGQELESSVLEYLHGHSNIIPGLENELTGLNVGDRKNVLVKAEDA
ncbi:MAG: FKBP-type peptidyl-prolyl cis-trans isomerase, partial [Anaerolineaceae bacterium]|nr:FKBP-type peptidyl-prolyl cis-trans isomerase [Anaerolineaceae bacterium]